MLKKILFLMSLGFIVTSASQARQSGGGADDAPMTVDNFRWYCKQGGGKIIIPPGYPGIKCQYADGTTIGCRFGRSGGTRICRGSFQQVKRKAMRKDVGGVKLSF